MVKAAFYPKKGSFRSYNSNTSFAVATNKPFSNFLVANFRLRINFSTSSGFDG